MLKDYIHMVGTIVEKHSNVNLKVMLLFGKIPWHMSLSLSPEEKHVVLQSQKLIEVSRQPRIQREPYIVLSFEQ